MTTAVLGGIGLFLLGMWMMTDGLKLAAGDTLQRILRTVTRAPWRGVAAGVFITALVQSSSAVTVATIGFVNAGLVNLAQSVWVVFGTNVGTTMTGWLVALVGVKVDIAALALPLLGIGMVLRLAARSQTRLAGLGQAIAGFGAFFLGIGFLQQGFEALAPQMASADLDQSRWYALPAFVGLGIALTIVTQSSSAAIAILLTASAGGGIPLQLAAAAMVGTSIGTTSTAAFAAIGATAPARRVAAAHVAFNLVAASVALAALPWLLAASGAVVGLAGAAGDIALMLALYHTAYKLIGLAIVWPLAPRLIAWLDKRFVSHAEEIARPRFLDANLSGLPQLALRSIVLEAQRMARLSFALARSRIAPAPSDAPPDGRIQDGLLQVGRSIRSFIAKINRQPLPDEIVEAIPDIVRGIQHLEDVLAISAQMSPVDHISLDDAQRDALVNLRQMTRDCLALTSFEDSHRPDEDVPEQIVEAIEAAYQALKAQLLHAAAIGRIEVADMETVLLHIRQLRACAESGRKAWRRLHPWITGLDNESELVVEPAALDAAR